MQITIQTPSGQRYTAAALDEIRVAMESGQISGDSWAWYEGLPEWIQVAELLEDGIQARPGKAAPTAAGKAAGLIAKAGFGLAGLAAKGYRKATLKNRFSKALASMLEDGRLEPEELQALQQMVKEAGGKWDEVVAECRPIAARFIRHQLADAIADEDVTAAEEREIENSIRIFGLEVMRAEVNVTIERVRILAGLRENRIPAPLNDKPIWLQSGEAAYIRTQAEFRKNGNLVSLGEIWVTANRVEFIAPKHGASIALKNIREIVGVGKRLFLTDVRGLKDYRVPDAEVVAAFVRCLLRAGHRTVTLETEDSRVDRRRISKEVRNAVWIRDGGACVECGADDYLEFDHLIPVAKGGSNTVANIQLLCRRCNGAKSDRI